MAIRRGVDFLIKTQNADGSWGTFESARSGEIYLAALGSHDAFRVATSALCTMALVEVAKGDEQGQEHKQEHEQEHEQEREGGPLGLSSGRLRDALKKGLHFLVSQEPVGRATGDVMYNVWAQAFTLQCLSRAALLSENRSSGSWLGLSAEEMKKAAAPWLRALIRMQSATGGWGYYDFGYGLRQPSGRQANSFTTATVLCALWDAERGGIKVEEHIKKAAMRCLASLRTADKTFVYGTDGILTPGYEFNRPKGALGRTQGPNVALYRYSRSWKLEAGGSNSIHGGGGEEKDSQPAQMEVTIDDLVVGLDRMFEHHHFMDMARGRPYPHEGWYATAGYYFFYGHFYAAEVISELPAEKARGYWEKLSAVLIETQQPDGSWWDFPLYGYHKPYGTALALLALVPSYDSLSEARK